MDHLLLNIGDWRGNKYLGPNTHEYEFEATNYLKEIFQFPAGRAEWGNSCTGSSEAILAAVIHGRTMLKAKTGKTPIVITSEEAHYCHKKCAFIAGLDCVVVKTDATAGMKMTDFRSCLSKLGDSPVIVIATSGTTVREGYDPIVEICKQLQEHSAGAYLHIDVHNEGALTVFMPRPSDDIVSKYTLACSDGGAHVITMQHVTTELLDNYIANYVDWHWGETAL